MPGVMSQPTGRRPTVLLADDHTRTAEQLRQLLQLHFDVVALVQDGSDLVNAVAWLSPDVIIAGISMPILDGIDAAADLVSSLGSSDCVRDGA